MQTAESRIVENKNSQSAPHLFTWLEQFNAIQIYWIESIIAEKMMTALKSILYKEYLNAAIIISAIIATIQWIWIVSRCSRFEVTSKEEVEQKASGFWHKFFVTNFKYYWIKTLSAQN